MTTDSKSIDDAILAIVNQTEKANVAPASPKKMVVDPEEYQMEEDAEEVDEDKKRKRTASEDEEEEEVADNNEELLSPEEESDEYDGAADEDAYHDREQGSVLSISRSGRKVIKPKSWTQAGSSTAVTYNEEVSLWKK